MKTPTLPADQARALFRAGRFAELIERAGAPLSNHDLSAEHQLLIARCLLLSGRTADAVGLVEPLSIGRLAPLLQSRCELILGLAAKRAGDVCTARQRLQHAVHLAREASSVEDEAIAQLSLFRLVAERDSQDVVKLVFSEARRLVTAAADPHLTVYLHDSVSLLETQTGRLAEARRHLATATSILERFPNAWLQQIVHTSQLCLACIECDFINASIHAKRARQLSSITGGYAVQHVLDVNEAHISIFRGRFGKAQNLIEQVLRQAPTFAKLSALDCIARMSIALNRLDECADALNLIAAARNDPSVQNSYQARWSTILHAKVLLRLGETERALQIVRRERVVAESLGDQSLVATLTVLEAEVLAEQGFVTDASVALFDATESGSTAFREYLGQHWDVWARVLVRDAPAMSESLRKRALRLWHHEGNTWARLESDWRVQSRLPIRDMPHPQPPASDVIPRTSKAERATAAYVLDRVCAAIDLSFDAKLVYAELAGIARAVGCGANIEASERTAGTEGAVGGKYAAVIGTGKQSAIQLRCSPSDDTVTNIVLSCVLRLARATTELANARQEERARTALWPETDISDADSLFLSPQMTALAATARKVAPTTVPVLITGETGTGKEILARAIHAASNRARAPFLPFNCSAGPREMIDAQLFGHRRGAFTGALEHAPGIVRAAATGTLFLDEIGEAPLDLQPKLLRFIESGEIHPVGEPHPAKVDVRLIAATNLDLDAAVSSGRFREDLFYRLNIVRLHLPPLRDRRVEIPVFAQHYLRKHARELGKGDLRLAEETVEYLLLYKWPGNVRQLANEMRRLAALAETDAVLMPEHLSAEILAARRTIPASERTLDSNEVVVRLDQPLAAATEHLERAMIPYALSRSAGRVEDAARHLGLSRKGLYLKRLRLGLDPPASHAQTA
jgi:DNA-binding NtrC family response regulator